MRVFLFVISILVLFNCQESPSNTAAKPASLALAKTVSLSATADTQRWYTKAQVASGRALFIQYCAGCHGMNAESVADWKTPVNGHYPPPPLDGSAHAWHHPLAVLDEVIALGGEPLGGIMPAWGGVLDAQQRLNIIASFQNYWNDDTYQLWLEREQASRGVN